MRNFFAGLVGAGGCLVLIAVWVACLLFFPWLLNTIEGILRVSYGMNIPDFAFWHWCLFCVAVKCVIGLF